MSVESCLRKARALIAAGWSEPFSKDTSGRYCTVDAEGIAEFSVLDAIIASAENQDEDLEAVAALERVLCPGTCELDAFVRRTDTAFATVVELGDFVALSKSAAREVTLEQWLEAPGRELKQVLAAFDRAILRAAAREGGAA